jgi:hypothetical protein
MATESLRVHLAQKTTLPALIGSTILPQSGFRSKNTLPSAAGIACRCVSTRLRPAEYVR